jgi:hypothetical protein
MNRNADDDGQLLSVPVMPKKGDLFELAEEVFFPVERVWFRPDVESRECVVIVEISQRTMQDSRPHSERTKPLEILLFSYKP